MTLLFQLIICLWLLPLAAQILLPLGMLVVWLVARMFGKKSSKQGSIETIVPRTANEAA